MKYYTIVILLLFISCNSSKDNNVDLFNGYSFQLQESEKVINVSTIVKNTYLDYIKDKNSQIPLFKNIKGKNYYLFIGLPVGKSILELHNSKLFEDIEPITSSVVEGSHSFVQYKKGANYYTEYIVMYEKNKIYILGVTDSQNISATTLSKIELANRIIK